MQDQDTTRLCACGCGKAAYPKKRYAPHHRAPGIRPPNLTCPTCGGFPSAYRQNRCSDAFHEESRKRAKTQVKRYQQGHRRELTEYQRRRYVEDPGVRARVNAHNSAWGMANRARMRAASRANTQVHRAIESGVLTRPSTCEQCGATTARIEAAHHDYSRPLNVRWLCRRCHVRWDKAAPKTGHHSEKAPTVTDVVAE